MTARYFVDSNVLIYARDVVEPAKQRRANDWLEWLWDEGSGRLSYQVLIESYSVLTAKGPKLQKAKARAYLEDFLIWQPLALDSTVMTRAWLMQERFGLSWWDSLIGAAAHLTECDYLLTEDLQQGQNLDGIIVINPFSTAPGAR
jgi:predicted nucleic acid-binding protein